MSKHSSAPIEDFAKRSFARASRSRRRRSKSTRSSQSTAIDPYVGKAIEFSLYKIRAEIAEVQPYEDQRSRFILLQSDISLFSAECARSLKHSLLARHGYIFQRRREWNWNM